LKVLELRSQIQELLTDEIGSYTLPGGVETPAIAVLDSGETISDRTVTGLEIIIRRVPIRNDGKAMFDCVRADRLWQIFLVQWQGDHTIQDALDKLTQKFPNTKAIPVRFEKGSGIREQFSVRISDELDALDWI
jgi:hypothetical protein